MSLKRGCASSGPRARARRQVLRVPIEAAPPVREPQRGGKRCGESEALRVGAASRTGVCCGLRCYADPAGWLQPSHTRAVWS
jgi:hypothetical protein